MSKEKIKSLVEKITVFYPRLHWTEYLYFHGTILLFANQTSLSAASFYEGPVNDLYFGDAIQKDVNSPLEKALLFLDEYFSGNNKLRYAGTDGSGNIELETSSRKKLVLDLVSFTEKEKRVYRELVKILPGETLSYGALAERSGIPRGGRFVGTAMAKNNFPVFIPCHRVIQASGKMGNYTGGKHIKRFLLEKEGLFFPG